MVYTSPFAVVPVSTTSLAEKLLLAIKKHADAHPTKPALVTAHDPTKSVTFTELYEQAHSVLAFLRSRGFKQGEVACLVLASCIEWPAFQLGVHAAGGAISAASAHFTDFELERQFIDSRCSVIFTDDANLEKVTKAANKCDSIKTIICLRNGSSTSSPLPDNVIDWSDVVACSPDYAVAKIDVETLAYIPYSSGTTGSPKGIMLSHRNFGTMIDIIQDHFEREVMAAIAPKDHCWTNETFLLNMPFYQIFGFAMLCTSLLNGSTAVVLDKFEPVLFLATIQKCRPRMLFIAPPLLIFLAKHPIIAKFDLSSLEFVLSGAAPAGKDICEEFLARHRNVRYLTQGYGMTECGTVCHLPDLKVAETYAGVGKVAANFEQKIIDVVSGAEVAEGERGEICVRSPTVMMGYL
ncbi:hypothetical protein PFISCL1PPCAC_13217, partial [Pristionchus fissidentatus]